MKRIFFVLGLCLAFCACNNKPKPEPEPTFLDIITSEDTVRVMNLVDEFFQKAEQGQFSEAAAMLYKTSPEEPYAQPEPLNNDEMAKVIATLQAIPPIRHNIESMIFNESYSNEVKCSIVFIEGDSIMPDAVSSFYLKPVYYLGGWSLCVMDSFLGDESLSQDTVQ